MPVWRPAFQAAAQSRRYSPARLAEQDRNPRPLLAAGPPCRLRRRRGRDAHLRATSGAAAPGSDDGDGDSGENGVAVTGATAQLAAEVRDQRDQVMTGVSVTWASSDERTARVDAAGLVTAVASGMATITATAGEASASRSISFHSARRTPPAVGVPGRCVVGTVKPYGPCGPAALVPAKAGAPSRCAAGRAQWLRDRPDRGRPKLARGASRSVFRHTSDGRRACRSPRASRRGGRPFAPEGQGSGR